MQTRFPSPKKVALALNQHEIAVATKFSVITAIIIAFYVQDLNLVFTNAISDEATYHILAIPILFGYLLYRKRKMVNATLQKENRKMNNTFTKNFGIIVGVLLCATAVLTYWHGSYTFTPIEYHMLTLPIFTAGLILIFFNTQTLKQLIFPIAFLFFLTPPPTEILYSVGSTLSDLSAHASNAIANAAGITSTISVQYGSPIIAITRPDQTIMNFSIDVACSGVYSLVGFIIFAVFIAYINRGKLWGKTAILLLGIPLIIILNIIRISTILIIGNSFGDELALQVFHTMGATVLMFIGTLILLITTDRLIKKPTTNPQCTKCTLMTPQNFCTACGKLIKYPKTSLNKADLVKIIGLILAIGVLLSIQAPVFALTEGPAQVLIQTPNGLQPNTETLPLPQIEGYNLSYVYRDTKFEELSGEDASLVYAYGSSEPNKPTVWVALELAQSTGPLHRWETCLINYPISQGLKPKVTQLDLTDIQTQANPPIVGRYFAFQYHTTNQTQVVLYWYETATFNVNNQTQQKHAKLSLVIYPKSPNDIRQYEELLLPIAKEINDYWQPIKTWTAVALTISQNGLALSIFTIALLIGIVFYRILLYRQERNSLLILYSKLSTQKQQLIQAVKNAKKKGDPTVEGIGKELKLDSQKDIEWLENELAEAENAGLIKKTVISMEDKPVLSIESSLSKLII